MELYAPIVFRYCRRRGLQEADAADVTQNVFSQVSRAVSRFQYDAARGRFRSWLGRITGNAINAHFRRRAPLADCLQDDHQPAARQALEPRWHDELKAQLFKVALVRIRQEIDFDTWRAFKMTWLEDCPPQEAAQALHRPVQWVYKAKFNVLQRLRAEIERLSCDDPAFLN